MNKTLKKLFTRLTKTKLKYNESIAWIRSATRILDDELASTEDKEIASHWLAKASRSQRKMFNRARGLYGSINKKKAKLNGT